MKAWLLTILSVVVLCIFCISCNENEDGNAVSIDRTKVQMTFVLIVGEPASRSIWEDPPYNESDNGNRYENTIDWTTLQILVYSADSGAYWGEVSNIIKIEQAGNIYKFTGELALDKSYLSNNTLNCRLMVFANSETQVVDASLESLTYNYKTQYIPMWGVKTINISVTDGYADLGENRIDLLRAMAKVIVTKDDINLVDYTLKAVSFDYYNPSGYFMPADYASVSETQKVSVGYHIPKGLQPATNLPFAGSGDRYVIYVPEYINNGALNPSSISVTLQKGTEMAKTYKIEFKEYIEGKPAETIFDIKRNHIYAFHIKSVIDQGGGGDIKVDVQTKVKPWNAIDVDSDYE